MGVVAPLLVDQPNAKQVGAVVEAVEGDTDTTNDGEA
jgi:hypothetical protein